MISTLDGSHLYFCMLNIFFIQKLYTIKYRIRTKGEADVFITWNYCDCFWDSMHEVSRKNTIFKQKSLQE
mgnify:CR=1 FL=1